MNECIYGSHARKIHDIDESTLPGDDKGNQEIS
jgi:hypothetical protein